MAHGFLGRKIDEAAQALRQLHQDGKGNVGMACQDDFQLLLGQDAHKRRLDGFDVDRGCAAVNRGKVVERIAWTDGRKLAHPPRW